MDASQFNSVEVPLADVNPQLPPPAPREAIHPWPETLIEPPVASTIARHGQSPRPPTRRKSMGCFIQPKRSNTTRLSSPDLSALARMEGLSGSPRHTSHAPPRSSQIIWAERVDSGAKWSFGRGRCFDSDLESLRSWSELSTEFDRWTSTASPHRMQIPAKARFDVTSSGNPRL